VAPEEGVEGGRKQDGKKGGAGVEGIGWGRERGGNEWEGGGEGKMVREGAYGEKGEVGSG